MLAQSAFDGPTGSALEAPRQALAQSPADPRLIIAHGNAFLQQGEMEAAHREPVKATDLAPYLANAGVFPNAPDFGQQGLFLPSGPSQLLENVERVVARSRQYGQLAGRSVG